MIDYINNILEVGAYYAPIALSFFIVGWMVVPVILQDISTWLQKRFK